MALDRSGKQSPYRAALLLLLPFLAYLPILKNGFINFDDPVYVTQNPHVTGGITGPDLAWAFSATSASNWHPLTWLSHMLDVQLFGLDPRGHHLTSVVIHAIATLLLYLLLKRATAAPWQSLFVAALFAVHPLHVESVAWVAERKDVLSGLFWMLTLFLYVRHARQPGSGAGLATIVCFAAGLMAKPMLVTLPVVLLLLDYWPLGRFRPADGTAAPPLFRLVKEKLPFFALSALSSGITIYAQHHGGALKNLDAVPFLLRLQNSTVATVKYVLATAWPHDLALLYPFPSSIPIWQVVGAGLLLTLVTALALQGRQRAPWLFVGWFWFLITLLPVIGLIQVGGQSMADRYTYIPLIGLFIEVAWGAGDLARNWELRRVALCVPATLIVCAAAAATWHQLGYWRDSVTLYRRTLQVTTGNYLILNNYGIALAEQGDLDGAIRQYREALRVWPRSANAQVNLGAALAQQGRFEEAIVHYREALRLIPEYALARGDLARALANLGRIGEALDAYEAAIRQDPSQAALQLNYALLLLKAGRPGEAANHYAAAVQLEPYSVKAPITMGVELAQQAETERAAHYFEQALRIDPNSVEAHFDLGVVQARMGLTREAAEQFEQVLKLRPDSAAARGWLEKIGGATDRSLRSSSSPAF